MSDYIKSYENTAEARELADRLPSLEYARALLVAETCDLPIDTANVLLQTDKGRDVIKREARKQRDIRAEQRRAAEDYERKFARLMAAEFAPGEQR